MVQIEAPLVCLVSRNCQRLERCRPKHRLLVVSGDHQYNGVSAILHGGFSLDSSSERVLLHRLKIRTGIHRRYAAPISADYRDDQPGELYA